MAETDDPVLVIFRAWPGKGGDVIALFPEIPATVDGRACLSYQHLGQHGGADYAHVIGMTRPATAAEIAPLRAELTAAPYGYRFIERRRYVPTGRTRPRRRGGSQWPVTGA